LLKEAEEISKIIAAIILSAGDFTFLLFHFEF